MVIIAKFTPEDARRYARAFASKNNNSQESQNTESQDRKDNKSKERQERQDNQTVKVNPRLEAGGV